MPFLPPKGTHPVKAAIWTITRLLIVSLVVLILLSFFGFPYHGNDLKKNAQASSKITYFVSVENDAKKYFEKFGYLPGDDPKPQDCGDELCVAGNGNGVIDGVESEYFISHLKRIIQEPQLPTFENFFVRAYAEEFQIGGQKLPKGIYFILSKNSEALEPSETSHVANRMDQKLDDGVFNLGRVRLFAHDGCFEDIEEAEDICASVFYRTSLDELRGIK